MEDAFGGPQDLGIELENAEELFDIGYADDVVFVRIQETCAMCTRQALEDHSLVRHVLYNCKV